MLNTRRTLNPGAALRTSCLLAALSAIGCTGQGTVHMVPFMRSDFGPAERPIASTPVTEAYYWLEPDGRLNIALRHHVASLLGKALESEWQMSIILDGLPAGAEKLYTLNARSVRAKHTRGPAHQRFASFGGVAVTEAPRNGLLSGRFHVTVRSQRFGVFSGWSPPLQRGPLIIMVGTFTAVENATRGREILERTEGDGFDRKSNLPLILRGSLAPASRPTGTRPAPDHPVATSPAPLKPSTRGWFKPAEPVYLDSTATSPQ
ncbi:MAG: hypothetical protein KA354_14270 [Phycisphaerae bacterium]|nr:hypothetical protein [Phycisphaerae bacterium]